MKTNYCRPFVINTEILTLCQNIGRHLGLLEGLRLDPAPIKLRKDNKIKTIQSPLSIEGNSLEIEQIRSILDGNLVLAPQKDILEVKNAIQLYENLNEFNPLSVQSLKKAHQVLMKDLINTSGRFREKGVGIFKGNVRAI